MPINGKLLGLHIFTGSFSVSTFNLEHCEERRGAVAVERELDKPDLIHEDELAVG